MAASREDDSWVFYEGRRYDVSKWLDVHPGGGDVITPFLGQDVTCALHMQHETRSPRFQRQLRAIDGGPAPDHPVSAFDRDYIALEQRFVDRGWFRPNPWWYGYKVALLFGILGLAVWATGPWLKGLFFGLFIQQSAFLAHDICHRAAVGDRLRRAASWLFGSVFFGLSHDKWVREHNTHHMLISRPAEDPQMNSMPHLLYSAREVEHFEATRRPLTDWERFKMGYQFIWLLPVLLLYGRVNICKGDLKTAWRQRSVHYLSAYALHYLMWIALIVQGSLETGRPLYFASAFIVTTLAVAGIIHLQLILSHAYAPRLFAHEQAQLGMRTQVVSNQNITTTFLDDWFHGGLQHHIEHHLFPRLPRHSLPKVRPYVQQLCRDHGLPYRSDPFPVCVANLFRSLYRQGAGMRAELRARSRSARRA